jgi:3',5'-cyclic AMP phosphodiesterase CpdA
MTLECWRPRHDDERRALVRALADERPAFLAHAGDVVCHGSRRADWTRFLADFEPVFSRGIPCFPAVGNHDYYGPNAAALARRGEVFPHVAGRRWFEVRFRSVLLVFLDSNFDELTKAGAGAQDEWFAKTLAAAEADPDLRHVLVVCHHPPYTNAIGLDASAEVRDRFVARLTPKVRVFAAGHVHSYERFVRNGVQFVVSGGAGGPRREVDTAAPRYEDQYRGPRNPAIHYCRFTLDGPALRCDVRMLQPDGTWSSVDGFTLR